MGTIEKKKVDASTYTFTERLYAGEDGAVYGFGDYRARQLLGFPGKVIPLDEAEELGLVAFDKNPTPVETKPPEDLPPAGVLGGPA